MLLAVAIAAFSARFGEHAIAAAGVAGTRVRQSRWSSAFRRASPKRALRQKEWTLLRRDPWLMSQTLMQMLYLIPPALMLWKSFGDGTGALVLLVPVLVMAAGQLAGGLAWLAISGEDAPDLVATAPVPARWIVRAKIEAVIGVIAMVFAPLVVAIAFASPLHALVTAAGRSRRRRVVDRDPALVPFAGQAQPLPPPADFVAARDLRRGVLVDQLGRYRRAADGQPGAGGTARPDGARGARRRPLAQSAQGS